jgi:class 3 adenylate cyclase
VRRPASLERLLFGVLAPIWAVGFALGLRCAVLGVPFLPVLVSGAPNAASYPVVSGFTGGSTPETTGLRHGDRLVRLGGTDLRGVGVLQSWALVAALRGSDEPVGVVFEREGQRGETALRLLSYSMSWPLLAASLVFACTALVLALRAPASPVVDPVIVACLVFAILYATKFGSSLGEVYAAAGLTIACFALAPPLALRAALAIPDGLSRRARLARFGPWIFSVFALPTLAVFLDRLSWERQMTALFVLAGIFGVVFLAVCAARYRALDPIARRRTRWVLLAIFVAATVRMPAIAWLEIAPSALAFQVLLASTVALALVPLAILVGTVRYNFFDVDRLLSATASLNVALVAALAATLLAVPRMAAAASGLVGIDPEAGRVALSLGIAAAVIPAQRRLRPRIERRFFKERHALEYGIAGLMDSLPACGDLRALTERLGEALDRLLRPEGCVVYAGAEGAFAPVFAAGRAVPPAFEAGSPLVATLRGRQRPLALSAAGRTPDRAALGPFDRAALEALQAEVVVPVRRDDALLAFLCLGPKRSGDVYTATDLSLLAAVAAAASAQLHRFDQEEVIAAGRAMQEALRRYVPGAVAEQLASGAAPAEGEREVAVLFVDIRGYTHFSEGHRSEELFSTVNRYTEAVSEAVRAQGGAVVEFNGDGMMAVFGAPAELAHKERAAVAAGRAILVAVARLPVEGGEGPLTVGVGIATGPAYVGSLRAVDRLIWTALGTTTNLASRLQALTRELDVPLVVDRATWERLGTTAADFELHPAVTLRGLRHAEDVYALAGGPPAAARTRRAAGLFRNEGDIWRIAWAGREVRLRDQRGFTYLAELLRHPGKEIHSLDLVRAGGGGVPLASAAAAAAASSASEAEGALSLARGLGGAGEAIDARARAAYRARLAELDEELAEAERHHDLGRLEALQEEREALVAELASAARGAGASVGSDAERARVAVTKGLKAAQDKIAASHPELAAHLAATLRRGIFCSYTPDPAHPVEWEA